MGKNLGFRAWFYFRQGWTTYFAFLFAAVNTLTVTYYLAIENLSSLKEIFPTFLTYLISVIVIGIPLLVLIGYVHYKKSAAFKAEASINMEANPYWKRVIVNTEVILESHLEITEILKKLINKEELTETEITKLSDLQKNLSNHISERIDNK